MVIRIKAKLAGGHVHVDFFTAKAENRTYESSGTLVFRDYEWPLVAAGFRRMLHAETYMRVVTGEVIESVEVEEVGFE